MTVDAWIQVFIAALIGFGAWFQSNQVRISKAAAVVNLEAQLAELDKAHEDEIAILNYIIFRCAVGMRFCEDTFGPGPMRNTMVPENHAVRVYFKDLLKDVYELPLSFRSKALTPLIDVLHKPEAGGSGEIYARIERMRKFLINFRDKRKSAYEIQRSSVTTQIEKFR